MILHHQGGFNEFARSPQALIYIKELETFRTTLGLRKKGNSSRSPLGW